LLKRILYLYTYGLVYYKTLFNGWNNCNYFGSIQAPSLTGKLNRFSTPGLCSRDDLDVWRDQRSNPNCGSCGGNFLVCASFLTYVLTDAFSFAQRHLFPCCFICRDCPYGCTLFFDDQGFSKIWNELIVPIRTTDE